MKKPTNIVSFHKKLLNLPGRKGVKASGAFRYAAPKSVNFIAGLVMQAYIDYLCSRGR